MYPLNSNGNKGIPEKQNNIYLSRHFVGHFTRNFDEFIIAIRD